VLRRRSFFSGHPQAGRRVKDVAWIRPDGNEMTHDDWVDPANHVLGMLLHGIATDEVDERGRPIFGDTILLLLNGGTRSRYYAMPHVHGVGVWHEILNTARPGAVRRTIRGEGINLLPHSLILLRHGEAA
jgi:glycogen operon protein